MIILVSTMTANKRTQKIESITIAELVSTAEQFEDAAKVMRDAIDEMEKKNVNELNVLYKQTFFRDLPAVSRARESTYEAWRALQMGKKIEISSRSIVTREQKTTAKKSVQCAESQLNASRKKLT